MMTPDDILAAWNTLAAATPPLKGAWMTPKRLAALRQRLREHPDEAIWRTGLAKIAASRFCRGENDRGWVASFSWLCERRDAIVKAAEGQYDDRPLHMTHDEAREYAIRSNRRRALGPTANWCRHFEPCATVEDHEERLKQEWLQRRRGERWDSE